MRLSTKAKASLDAVVSRFKTGDLSPIVEIAQIRRDPNDVSPAASWSFKNQVLAYLQTNSLDCRGYRQWQTVGRHVRKGARAAYIFAPCTRLIENDTTGEKESRVVGFRSVPVFPLHQTDGNDLQKFNYTPDALPPLADLAAAFEISGVDYVPTINALGSYNIQTHKITLGTHDIKTWFHELGHAIHAKTKKLRGGQDPHQETVAEFTATVLMWFYGYGDRTGNAWEYIAGYNKNPLTAILKALGEVEKILQTIEEVTKSQEVN